MPRRTSLASLYADRFCTRVVLALVRGSVARAPNPSAADRAAVAGLEEDLARYEREIARLEEAQSNHGG
jgi:hypothetical protein